jgi:hypothetical protein
MRFYSGGLHLLQGEELISKSKNTSGGTFPELSLLNAILVKQ